MRSYAVLLLVVLLGVPAQAQVEPSFGIKAGANASTVFADLDEATYQLLPGLSASVFVELPLTSTFSVQPEAGYVQRGFLERFDEDPEPEPLPGGTVDPEEIQTRYRLHYVSLPIIAKARFPGERFSPYVLAGPRVDLLVHTSRSLEAPIPPPPQVPPDHTERYRPAAFGATVGVGLGPGFFDTVPLFVEARYHLDVTDSYNVEANRMHNWGLDLMLGIQF